MGIDPKKTIIQRSTCTPVFTAALFTIAKTWRQYKCSSADEWIKPCFIYTLEYYSAVKKNEMMPLVATWMDPELIILSDVSETKTNII